MPDVIVTKRWSDRRISVSGEIWTATESYDVTGVPLPADALTAVDTRTGLAVPQDGESHPANGMMVVTGRDVSSPGPLLYRVSVQYSMQAPDAGEGSDGADNSSIEAWTEDGNETIVIDRDIKANAILNAASDPPEQLPTRDLATQTLCFKRREALFDNQWALSMRNTVNSGDIRICGFFIPKGHGRILTLGIAEPFKVSRQGWLWVLYRILTRPLDPENPIGNAFPIRFQNAGYNGFWEVPSNLETGVTAYPAKGPICGQDKEPVNRQALLDETGKPLDGSLKITRALKDAIDNPNLPKGLKLKKENGVVFCYYENYLESDFSHLDLPPKSAELK